MLAIKYWYNKRNGGAIFVEISHMTLIIVENEILPPNLWIAFVISPSGVPAVKLLLLE